MMQHNRFEGTPIGAGHLTYADRSRLEKLHRIESAARICSDDSPWFALRCWTGREMAVQEHLEQLGITALVPMRKGPDLRRRHRVVPGQMMPVIHGYVLVQIVGKPECLAALDAVDHAIAVLGGADSPKRISSEEVKRFRALAAEGAYDWHQVVDVFRKGQKVRAKDGPFATLTGEVISARMDGRGDAVVEFNVFGRLTPVNLPLAFLEKI